MKGNFAGVQGNFIQSCVRRRMAIDSKQTFIKQRIEYFRFKA
jgi:hypothetical protein